MKMEMQMLDEPVHSWKLEELCTVLKMSMGI